MKLLLAFCCMLAQCLFAQTSITIHKAYNVSQELLELDLHSAKIDIRETKSSRILVEINIVANVASPTILNYLANEGRYDLTLENLASTNKHRLSAPKERRPLMVKGKAAEEEISYIIYLPPSIKHASNSLSAAVSRK